MNPPPCSPISRAVSTPTSPCFRSLAAKAARTCSAPNRLRSLDSFERKSCWPLRAATVSSFFYQRERFRFLKTPEEQKKCGAIKS